MRSGAFLVAIALLLPSTTMADTLVATRVLKARTIIAAEDLTLARDETPGSLDDPADVIGMETRIAIYAGQPIRPQDVGPPAIVDRNQRIPIAYRKGGLLILAEGRALARGAVGDTIRVMNNDSKATVEATIASDGIAYVHSE